MKPNLTKDKAVRALLKETLIPLSQALNPQKGTQQHQVLLSAMEKHRTKVLSEQCCFYPLAQHIY